jgi:hypothetical protein
MTMHRRHAAFNTMSQGLVAPAHRRRGLHRVGQDIAPVDHHCSTAFTTDELLDRAGRPEHLARGREMGEGARRHGRRLAPLAIVPRPRSELLSVCNSAERNAGSAASLSAAQGGYGGRA